jgi:hypothetical protein
MLANAVEIRSDDLEFEAGTSGVEHEHIHEPSMAPPMLARNRSLESHLTKGPGMPSDLFAGMQLNAWSI